MGAHCWLALLPCGACNDCSWLSATLAGAAESAGCLGCAASSGCSCGSPSRHASGTLSCTHFWGPAATSACSPGGCSAQQFTSQAPSVQWLPAALKFFIRWQTSSK